MRVTVSEMRTNHMPITGDVSRVTVNASASENGSHFHIIGNSPQTLRELADFINRCADAFDQPQITEAAE